MIYALVSIGRSGEPFPDGIEIYALPYAQLGMVTPVEVGAGPAKRPAE